MSLGPLDNLDELSQQRAQQPTGLENRAAELEGQLDSDPNYNPAPAPADAVPPSDTLAPLDADKASDGFNQPPQDVTDFARNAQLDQLEQPLPQAPAATWDQISQSPRFQGLAPADKLTVVKKYAGNLLDWQQSQTGADAGTTESRINKWVEDKHNELFPTPQPKGDESGPVGKLLGFDANLFKSEVATLGQSGLSAAKGVLRFVNPEVQKQQINANDPKWIQDLTGWSNDKAQAMHDWIAGLGDKLGKVSEELPSKIGVKENTVSGAVGKTLGGLAPYIASLPAAVASHVFSSYGDTLDKTGSGVKAGAAAAFSGVSDLAFMKLGEMFPKWAEGVLPQKNQLARWASKIAVGTAGNIDASQLIKAGEAAIDAKPGDRLKAFRNALTDLDLKDVGVQAAFAALGAKHSEAELAQTARAAEIKKAHDQFTQDQTKAADYDQKGMPLSAKAQREAAHNKFQEAVENLDKAATTNGEVATPEQNRIDQIDQQLGQFEQKYGPRRVPKFGADGKVIGVQDNPHTIRPREEDQLVQERAALQSKLDAAESKSGKAEPTPEKHPAQDLMTERNKLFVQELPKHAPGTNGRARVEAQIADLDKQIKDISNEHGNRVAEAAIAIANARKSEATPVNEANKTTPQSENGQAAQATENRAGSANGEKPNERIAGPVLTDDNGNILVAGKLGESHKDLMNHALSNGHDVGKVLESFDKDENHRFETESGKVVTRDEAGKIADNAKQRGAEFAGAGLQSEHLVPNEQAKPEASSNGAVSEPQVEEAPAKPAKTETAPVPVNGSTPVEVAHNAKSDLGKQLSVPKGASTLLVTDAKGRKTRLALADLKGANPLHEAGPFKKIEAGTIGKGNNFIPMSEAVTLKEPSKLKALVEAAKQKFAAAQSFGITAGEHQTVAEPEPSDLRFNSAKDAHQHATTEGLKEIVGDKAPADLDDQVGKRYATVQQIVNNRADKGRRAAATEAMLDLVRDDMLANAEATGNPFKTESGADYSVQARLLGTEGRAGGKLTNWLDKGENTEASNTVDADKDDETASHVDEPVASEQDNPANFVADLEDHNNVVAYKAEVAKTFDDFSNDKNNQFEEDATPEHVKKAARIVLDEIAFGKSVFGELRGVKNDGAVSKLIKNEKFVEAVFDKIYNPLVEQARSHFEGVKTKAEPTTQGLADVDAARAALPPVHDPASKSAQALHLVPGYMDVADGVAKLWKETVSNAKGMKPARQWGAWLNAARTKANVFAHQKTNDVRGALREAFGRKQKFGAAADLTEVAKSAGRYVGLKDRKIEASKRDAAALTFAVQAKGDKANLAQMRKTITDAIATIGVDRPRGWQQKAHEALAAIDHAEKNWDRIQPAVDGYNKTTFNQFQLEHLNGFKTVYREGYVPQMHEMENLDTFFGSNTGTGGTGFTKMRSHETYADALAAGEVPKTYDSLDLLQHRIEAGTRAVNMQKWAETGRSIIDPNTQAPLIADTIKDTHPVDGHSFEYAPEGYETRHIGFNTIAVHKQYASVFDSFTRPSAIRQSKIGNAILKTEGSIKHGLLVFDSYHLGRLAYYQLGLRPGSAGTGFSKGLLTLDYSSAELQNMERRGELPDGIKASDLIKRKDDLGKLIDNGLNVGTIADNIAPHFIRNLPFVGDFNRFVFEKFQRAGITQSALIELERQRNAFPELSEADLTRKVSRELNTRFGNLGKEGALRSDTMRDLLQMSFLAPGWNEGLLKSEVGGYKQLGEAGLDAAMKRQFRAGALLKTNGTLFAGIFAMNQIINYATRQQFTWQNQEDGVGAKLSAYIPDYVGGGPGFFLNPFSLPAELTHQVLDVIDRGSTPLQAVAQVAGYKASPIFHAAKTFGTRTDRFGRPLNSDWDVMGQMVADVFPAPISITSIGKTAVASREAGHVVEEYKGATQKQLFSSAGVKLDSAPSAITQTLRHATDFNKKHGIIRDPRYSSSDYSQLTQALNVNDDKRAQQEYNKVAATKTKSQIDKHFAKQASYPFTGTRTRERAFYNTLTDDQKKTYHDAVDSKRKLRQQYFQLHLKAPKPTK